MATPDFGPFGAYANVTEIVSAAAQTAILAEIDKLLALIPDGSEGQVLASPEFDRIHPLTGTVLRAEIVALKAAIDAAPTA